MSQVQDRIREIELTEGDDFFGDLAREARPAVLRGLAADWPLVEKSLESRSDAEDYLLSFYREAPVTAFLSESPTGGRIFYTENLDGHNFRQVKVPLDQLLAEMRRHADDSAPPTIYTGSMALDYCLPGLREAHSLPLGPRQATVRIWIGNGTIVAAHYDVMDNVACVCAGRRRFTLFPPEQLPNLYVGPIDFTPAGQPVSLVDPREPDLDRHPRYAEALAHAQTAELEPGDAIFIPSMWWHQVEALESFNILINHWWRDVPSYLGAPADALLHAILSLRDLPQPQRDAWRSLFDHYVFDAGEDTVAHIPENRRGVLGDLDDDTARQLRALLRNRLNR